MIFFTIASRNFTAYAIALWSTIAMHHPQSLFYLVLCDNDDNYDHLSLPFNVVFLRDLNIIDFDSMTVRYNVTELNTAIKPSAFSYLFDMCPGKAVVYLDPDIKLFGPLVELEEALSQGKDCVLTPHILAPQEYAEMDDAQFLNYGIYNLGFLALNNTPEVRRIVEWWGRRLRHQCIIDRNKGLFVDQKWADHFPVFIANTLVLRHPGYNVAYWNLAERRIEFIENTYFVNREWHLRFFHFSGLPFFAKDMLTRHSRQFTLHNTEVLADVLRGYNQDLIKCGHRYYRGIPFAFSWLGDRGKNEHTPLPPQKTESTRHLPLARFRAKIDFDEHRKQIDSKIKQRKKVECDSIPGSDPFLLKGFCHICGSEQMFQTSQMYSSGEACEGRLIPNWREHLNCVACGFVNRVRGAFTVIDQLFPIKRIHNVYITEQATDLFRYLAEKWPNVVGSEYLSSSEPSGTTINDLRHEDLQCLSFAKDSFDFILSFDVLEHVPDRQKSFEEIFRCLRDGGRLVFTVPFSHDHQEEIVRAIWDGKAVRHVMEPEFHGNPVDPEGGSLCFRYFGWSVLDHLRAAGFSEVEVICYWSADLLHFADPQKVVTGVKRSAKCRS